MCAAICPKNAISIVLNADGFYRPEVNEDKCIDCGLCTNVCYKFDTDITDCNSEKLSKTILLGARAKDPDVVSHTTSGGIADLLAHELVEEGCKCIGVVYDPEKDNAKHIIVDDKKNLTLFRGSKYIQSYTLDAFNELLNKSNDATYAIFGTPCQIYAVNKYAKKQNNRNNIILIDLYCHGCPSMNIWKKYITEIKDKLHKSKIDNVNFRSKANGWGKFKLSIKTDDKLYNSRNNDFFELFFCDQLLNEACYDCKLRRTLAYTDIRLGDFWGKRYILNDKGVSAVSIVTKTGKTLFDKIKDKVEYKEERYEDFLPWQNFWKQYQIKTSLRNVLLSQLQNKNIPLKESVLTIYNKQTPKQKFLRYAKRIINLMPLKIEKRIRWVFYKL